ncbi:MAG: DUF2141 domain-containing protein [Hyphomonadaceae bacterium]|nr:DUF2141 domain-containing protein [Hyphomonadaceae bacterium]
MPAYAQQALRGPASIPALIASKQEPPLHLPRRFRYHVAMRRSFVLVPLLLSACASLPDPVESVTTTVTTVRDWIWPPPVAPLAIAPLEAPAVSAQPLLTLTVSGLKTADGPVRAGLFAADGWNGDPVFSAEAPVADGVATLTLRAPAPGRYALKIYHDLNNDAGLNRAAYGMPTEPYGFSNNADGRFGPPSFDAAAFDLPAKGAAHAVALN